MTKALILGVKPFNTFALSNENLLKRALEKQGVLVSYLNLKEISLESLMAYDVGDIVFLPNQISFIPNILFEDTLSKIEYLKTKQSSTVFFNGLDSHLSAADNIYSLNKLKDNNLPVYNFKIYYYTEDDYIEKIESMRNKVTSLGSYPLILRDPLISVISESCKLCSNETELIGRLTVNKTYKGQQGFLPLLLHKLFDNDSIMFSVKVVGNKIYSLTHLNSPYNNDRTRSSFSPRCVYLKTENYDELNKLAIEAANILSLDVCRITFVKTQSTLEIFDVCSMGSIFEYELFHNTNISDEIVNLGLKRIG